MSGASQRPIGINQIAVPLTALGIILAFLWGGYTTTIGIIHDAVAQEATIFALKAQEQNRRIAVVEEGLKHHRADDKHAGSVAQADFQQMRQDIAGLQREVQKLREVLAARFGLPDSENR